MSLALKNPTTHDNIALPNREPSASAGGEPHYIDDGLLVVAGPIMVVCYGLLFTVAALTFVGTGEASFAVGIGAGLALVFFSVPALFLRIRAARDPRWRRDPKQAASRTVVVCTGPMPRREAIVQIVSIPIVIVVGFTVLAIRWSLL